jgi:transcriptional regulator with XRE-family HTH domain
MATPLQAVRRARGWSQSRTIWELTRLAQQKRVKVASDTSLKTLLSRWENGHAAPEPFYRDLLCAIYKAAPRELGFGSQSSPSDIRVEGDYDLTLLDKQVWSRDEVRILSDAFDEAISRTASADIELLAHEWLSADPPQRFELDSGRRVGESLISAVEQRVIQLRHADDYISGRSSYALVRKELQAATDLLRDGVLTEAQSRRVLSATGELAQLAAWVAADAGLYREASRYIQGGVLAANAADDQPLVANIISTFSYQLSNTGDPRRGAIIARTAYAGIRRNATAATKALLLERVAWGDAKSGDLSSCRRSLGLVQETFDGAESEEDPSWVYWLNRQEIEVMEGRCLTELKQAAEAESVLRIAMNGYDRAVRENSLYLSWLAEDYILLGEIDQAAAVTSRVLELAASANSARTDSRLRHLISMLRRYDDVASAAEVINRYRDVS